MIGAGVVVALLFLCWLLFSGTTKPTAVPLAFPASPPPPIVPPSISLPSSSAKERNELDAAVQKLIVSLEQFRVDLAKIGRCDSDEAKQ